MELIRYCHKYQFHDHISIPPHTDTVSCTLRTNPVCYRTTLHTLKVTGSSVIYKDYNGYLFCSVTMLLFIFLFLFFSVKPLWEKPQSVLRSIIMQHFQIRSLHGHRFKVSCTWLNKYFYLNSHRWYLSHLIYVSCLVFLLVSGDRDYLRWLSRRKIRLRNVF